MGCVRPPSTLLCARVCLCGQCDSGVLGGTTDADTQRILLGNWRILLQSESLPCFVNSNLHMFGTPFSLLTTSQGNKNMWWDDKHLD